MSVVFALLVVAVIGVGVMIAVRRPDAGVVGEPIPDGPAAVAPDGPLTAADLRAVRFPIVFRGYRPAEVDALLARLEQQLPVEGPAPAQAASEADLRPAEHPIEPDQQTDRPEGDGS